MVRFTLRPLLYTKPNFVEYIHLSPFARFTSWSPVFVVRSPRQLHHNRFSYQTCSRAICISPCAFCPRYQLNACKNFNFSERRRETAVNCWQLTVERNFRVISDLIVLKFYLLFFLLSKNDPENEDDIKFFRKVGIFLTYTPLRFRRRIKIFITCAKYLGYIDKPTWLSLMRNYT
jgi:hypothetical protein